MIVSSQLSSWIVVTNSMSLIVTNNVEKICVNSKAIIDNIWKHIELVLKHGQPLLGPSIVRMKFIESMIRPV